jgi:tetratricopeptide (TPR) repeat protein
MKPGRNENCPCGSGVKYKRCCGRASAPPPTAAAPHPARTPQRPPRTPHPNEIGALVALVDRDRLSEAERQAQTLLTVYPDAGLLWKILGVALMRQGKDPLQALQKASDLLPADAEALGNLGLAQHDQRLWAEALPNLTRALDLRPNDEQTLVAAANALVALGRASESVALYRRVLRLNPRSVEALNHLGNVRRASGDLRDAISLYAQAVEADPALAESHCNLGNALLESRRVDEAVASYERAVAINPHSALAHVSLATGLRLQARGADAASSCRAALALAPDDAEALSLLGELEADRGRFAEAHELFHRAIAVDPNFPFAFCSIAAHRKMTAADTAWVDGVSSLRAGRPPLRHAINLNFAVGKYFDDVQRYDQAFERYRHAHELAKVYGSTYDAAKLTRRIDRLMSIFDAPCVSAAEGCGLASELPVFVIGMPRSGTSLAEQILASHPSVFGAGEVVFWDAAFNAYETAGTAAEEAARRLRPLAREYLDRIRAVSGGATRVVDKLPANFLYAGMILAALPGARIIHMRRHPVDTCLSIYFQNFFNMAAYANDLGDLADYYTQYLRITAHWRAVLPAVKVLEVPYEGLIEDQEGWSRRMLDFIGLPWDPQCLNFHETERPVLTASKWQVRQKIHHQSAGRWRNYRSHLGPLRRLSADIG